MPLLQFCTLHFQNVLFTSLYSIIISIILSFSIHIRCQFSILLNVPSREFHLKYNITYFEKYKCIYFTKVWKAQTKYDPMLIHIFYYRYMTWSFSKNYYQEFNFPESYSPLKGQLLQEILHFPRKAIISLSYMKTQDLLF